MAHVQTRKQTARGRTTYRLTWKVKREDGTWRDQYGPTRDTWQEADDDLTAWKHSQRTGSYVDPSAGRRLFRDWWDEWQQSRTHLRPATVARDDSYARTHVLPAFGHLELAAIDPLTAQRWVNDLQKQKKAAATVQKASQLASGAMKAAVRQRLIATNPFADVTLPRIERKDMRFLTPDQVATLADTIQPDYRAFVVLAAYAGLRFGELSGLRANRVDLIHRRVVVDQNCVEVQGIHHIGKPKTAAGRRSVPIPRHVADVLAAHLAATGATGDDLVFTSPRGGPLRASLFRRRVWQPAVEVAGLSPLRIHDLRHTAVSFWIAAGASPLAVAHLAGHTSAVVVLDRYGHLLPDAHDSVMDALDGMAMDATPASLATVAAIG